MHGQRRALAAAALVAALGLAACSDEDQEELEELEDSAESVVAEVEEEVEDAARTAASEVEEAADEVARDAAELAVRTIAAEQGEEQFSDAGHPLDDGGLECEATASDGLDAIDVTCTGTTEHGDAAEMTGATSEMPGESVTEIKGSFTGTVGGEEVFTADALGG